MKSCKRIQSLLYPYLDGELSIQENLEVEAHVLECQDCNDILQEQKRFLTMLHSSSLREKGPDELRDRIARQLKPRKSFELSPRSMFTCRRALGLAAAVMLCFFVVATILLQRGVTQPFIQNTVAEHEGFLHGKEQLQFVTSNPGDLTQWLQERIGVVTSFPNFDDANVVLVGARVSQYKGMPIGLVSYRVHEVPVTLMVALKTPDTDIETSDYHFVDDRRINYMTADGFNVVSWSVCSNNFALVSSLPRQGKEGCTVCHANGSGLIDLSAFYSKT